MTTRTGTASGTQKMSLLKRSSPDCAMLAVRCAKLQWGKSVRSGMLRARTGLESHPTTFAPRLILANRVIHNLPRLRDHRLQMLIADKTLGINLIDILGPRRPCREPAVLGDDL